MSDLWIDLRGLDFYPDEPAPQRSLAVLHELEHHYRLRTLPPVRLANAATVPTSASIASTRMACL
jgi:hypothetical protein